MMYSCISVILLPYLGSIMTTE